MESSKLSNNRRYQYDRRISRFLDSNRESILHSFERTVWRNASIVQDS